MSKTDSERIKKRLTWITPSKREQADWIKEYLEQRKELMPWFTPIIPTPLESKEYVELFKSAVYDAVACPAASYERVQSVNSICNKLKAAWNSRQRRKENKTKTETAFSISNKARSQLEMLAKKQKCSFSLIVESLVLKSKEISILERKLTQERDSELDREARETPSLHSMLEQQIKISALEEQLVQLKKQNEKLEERLSTVEAEKDTLAKKVADYEQDTSSLRTRVTELNTENQELKSLINSRSLSRKDELSFASHDNQCGTNQNQGKEAMHEIASNSEKQTPALAHGRPGVYKTS
ncbi:hypothetical protein [Vibrio parahaemolyticus]|uniref:hypothetical protein n=1 Tax=Vibrio parahaemolyticus TaxID=670 RepID=UPI001FAC925D|nr:hypothetical protein [Vibrio parahaemolyticus]MCI9689785.1 hypothetical protein [Vibrio parahaemolyticus]